MPSRLKIALSALAALAGVWVAGASPADDAMDEINKYRELLKEANPAELLELQGEMLWTTSRGPRQATLEKCDFGLGPGVLEGAYARLPRYFADTGKVQDLESRLVTCMLRLQGLTLSEATAGWYKSGSDMEALLTYVAARSKGRPIEVKAQHPAEQEMLRVGEALFYRRAGPLDFSCATCHALDARRIRLQELPNLATPAGAQASMSQWPAYRVSQGAVWGLERRLIDCLRQMRLPDADFLSDAVVALELYMQRNADGAVLEAPGIKR